jgi:DNA-binding NarL/FixJ family response regulator
MVAALADLTPRERDCATLIPLGLTNSEIGDLLGLSPRTVQSYVQDIMWKTGLHTRVQIAVWMVTRAAAADTTGRRSA